MKIKIKLSVPYYGYEKEVDATVFGDWAAHGVVEKGPDSKNEEVSDKHFSVTHVPSGRSLVNHTGFLPRDYAEEIARRLSLLGPVGVVPGDELRTAAMTIICEVLTDLEELTHSDVGTCPS